MEIKMVKYELKWQKSYFNTDALMLGSSLMGYVRRHENGTAWQCYSRITDEWRDAPENTRESAMADLMECTVLLLKKAAE